VGDEPAEVHGGEDHGEGAEEAVQVEEPPGTGVAAEQPGAEQEPPDHGCGDERPGHDAGRTGDEPGQLSGHGRSSLRAGVAVTVPCPSVTMAAVSGARVSRP